MKQHQIEVAILVSDAVRLPRQAQENQAGKMHKLYLKALLANFLISPSYWAAPPRRARPKGC